MPGIPDQPVLNTDNDVVKILQWILGVAIILMMAIAAASWRIIVHEQNEAKATIALKAVELQRYIERTDRELENKDARVQEVIKDHMADLRRFEQQTGLDEGTKLLLQQIHSIITKKNDG